MKREAKIGIFGVAMILLAWGGIRFLSGLDVFARNVEYVAAYDQVSGVAEASAVMMKGVKVGTVGLGPRGDWAMPSDAAAALWLEEAQNL